MEAPPAKRANTGEGGAAQLELAPGRFVGGTHDVFIIAEGGLNHQVRHMSNRATASIIMTTAVNV